MGSGRDKRKAAKEKKAGPAVGKGQEKTERKTKKNEVCYTFNTGFRTIAGAGWGTLGCKQLGTQCARDMKGRSAQHTETVGLGNKLCAGSAGGGPVSELIVLAGAQLLCRSTDAQRWLLLAGVTKT